MYIHLYTTQADGYSMVGRGVCADTTGTIKAARQIAGPITRAECERECDLAPECQGIMALATLDVSKNVCDLYLAADTVDAQYHRAEYQCWKKPQACPSRGEEREGRGLWGAGMAHAWGEDGDTGRERKRG